MDINLAVDARTLGVRPSGIGIYTYDFLQMFLKKKICKITLLTDVAGSDEIRALELLGAQIELYGKYVFRSSKVYRYYRFIRKYLIEKQPAIFWEPNNLIPISLKGYDGKCVVTIHDVFPILMNSSYSFLYRNYFKISMNKTLKRANGIIFNSRQTQNDINQKYSFAFDKKEFVSHVIVPQLRVQDQSAGDYFLYIGNLEKRKGTDLLIEGYKKYWTLGGRRRLYLIGNIREKDIGQRIREIANEIPGLLYLGYLKEEEKENWLGQCYCFVFPTRAEGFGTPPLEAMSYRRNLLLSDLPIFDETAPGIGKRISLQGAKAEIIDRLGKELFQVCEPIDEEKYEAVLKKFSADELSEQLWSFFIEIIGE